MGFGLEEEGVLVVSVREGREVIPPYCLNKLHDTAALVLFFFPSAHTSSLGYQEKSWGGDSQGKKGKSVQINKPKWHSW